MFKDTRVQVHALFESLDGVANREGDKFLLHAATMNYSRSVEAALAVEGVALTGERVLEIALEDPWQEVSPLNLDVFKPREHALPSSTVLKWRFPACPVSSVELEMPSWKPTRAK